MVTAQQDTDGYRVSYTYSAGDNRIIKVSESQGSTAGQTYGITYNPDNSTTFRYSGVDDVYGNSDDIQNIHVFDEQGRAICIYSKSVSENRIIGASACTYQTETDDGGTRNKIKDSAVVGMHSNNLLVNHSFEYSDSTWTLYKNDTATPESGALSASNTGKKYIGTHSACVNMAKRTGGTAGFKQNVNLAAGTYTFSAYISAASISNTSAYLKVNTGNGTVVSNRVTKDTDASFDNGWERQEVTFTISSARTVTVYLETDCGSTKGAGKVCFDCAQLEAGSVANDYNILEDGSFELTTATLPYKWSNLSNSTIKQADERVAGGVDGSYCYKITGQPGKNKYLRFTTNLGGSKNGYVLSGWVKSNTTPTRSGRAFKVMAYNEQEEEILQTSCKINTCSQGWKYFCLLLPAKSWGSTEFTVCFYDNIGELYIDGLQLTRNDVQTQKYDSLGRVTSSYTAIKSDSYTYDSYNRMKKHTTAAGNALIYTYNGMNDITKVTADIGPDTHYSYDKYGNCTVSQSYASDAEAGTATRYYASTAYTADGNFPASSTDTAGNTTFYTYNERTGQLLQTLLPGIAGAGTVNIYYNYDAKDRITSVTQGERSVSYTYGAFDDVTGITHNGFTYGFTYDGFGNVLTTSIAGKVISTNYYQPGNGSLIKSVLADGTTTQTTYDAYGRVTSSSMNGSTVNSYVYDNDGNVAKKTDAIGNLTTKYDYNDSGLVVRTEVYKGASTASANLLSRMQYTYTKSGKVGGLSYQEKDGTVRTYAFTYAKDELPTKSTHPDGSITAWTYDALRRNTKTVFTPKSGAADGRKLYTAYTYQSATHTIDGKNKTTATELVSTLTNRFGSSGSAVSKFTYAYDSWGNITGITDLADRKKTYTYNQYGEIVTASETYSDGSSKTYAYTYDAGGNILTEKAGSTTHTYKYDSVWKDKLVSYDGKTITYDVFGCPVNYMGSTMTWDVNGNLTAVTRGSDKISYTYLSDGNRSSKTVNGTTTTYSYNNGMLLSETTGNETLHYYYDGAGRVASIGYQKGTAAEVLYFFTRNLQGDIIGVYRSSDSKLIGTYEYDLWGRLISVKEAGTGIDTNGILTKNPIRYRGYYYDNETGFYNLDLRYYDPSIRRFISADSTAVLMTATKSIQCKNLFNYSENNPVSCKDSSGAIVETVFDIVSLGFSIYDVYKNPGDPWAWAGLAGDLIDLIPVVTGVGEAVKGARYAVKYGDDVGEAVADTIRLAGKADKAKDASKAAKGVSKSGSEASGNLLPYNLQLFGGSAKNRTRNTLENISDINKIHTPDQQALMELAKETKRNGGTTLEEANILMDWAKEYNVPVHGPEIHLDRPGAASNILHFHIGRTGHIPIYD